MLFSSSTTPKTRVVRQWSARGFSLVELMVTVGIVILVTGVSLVRYGSFNNAVLMRSQAYEIALDVREAQLAGVSVRPSEDGANPGFREAYGVAFNLARDHSGDGVPDGRNFYQLFVDANDNNRYDAGEEGDLEPFVIDPRFEIASIQAHNGCSANIASVVFRRPNFDGLLYTSGTGCPGTPETVVVTLRGTQDQGAGVTRSIVIERNGLITVQ